MDFNLKKSKMFLLSIIPFLCIVFTSSNFFNSTSTVDTQNIFNSQSLPNLIGLFIGTAITLFMFSIYIYLGTIFYKKKELTFFKVFAILNFVYFGLSAFLIILNIFIPNPTKPVNQTLLFTFTSICYILIILFNAINIFLIFNYNHHSKKLSFA